MDRYALVCAARRKLQENASVDMAAEDRRVSFRKHVGGEIVNYYVPDIFHLCWTMQDGMYVDTCMFDMIRTKKVSEIYKNEGFKSDMNNIRMLKNWPLRGVSVVGKIMEIEKWEDTMVVFIDDGSFEGENGSGNIVVRIGQVVWATMELENVCVGLRVGWTIHVYGIMRKVKCEDGLVVLNADRVDVVGKKNGDELKGQIEWWRKVNEIRGVLAIPWVIDMESQDAMEALRSIEAREEEKEKERRRSGIREDVEGEREVLLNHVIEIDDEENEGNGVEVVNLEGKIMSMDEWIESKCGRRIEFNVGNAEMLEFTLLRTLCRLIVRKPHLENVTFEELYSEYEITVVLNGIVLAEFFESAVRLGSDAEVHGRWAELRLRGAKTLLLRGALGRVARAGGLAGGAGGSSVGAVGAVGVGPLRAAVGRVRRVFASAGAAGAAGEVAVPVGDVGRELWPGAGRLAAAAVVAGLVGSGGRGGGIDGRWVLDEPGERWRRAV